MIAFDHLIVAAATLEEGAGWVEERLGVPLAGGGKHVTMGTHNRTLSLGPGRYLEVMAIDPAAPAPRRPRWVDLDDAAMQARLAGGPTLALWIARTDALEAAVAALSPGAVECLAFERGDFRWRMGVPPSGHRARHGTMPMLLEWNGPHPTERLPESGCRLEELLLVHPEAPATLAALHRAGMPASEPVAARAGPPGLVARIRTPRGIQELAV